MLWETELVEGVAYLNQHFKEVTNDGISIKIHKWDAIQTLISHEPHKHSFYQATYVLNGKGTYIEGKRKGEIKNGSLILTPPDTNHKVVTTKGLDILLVNFKLETSSDEYIQKLFNSVKKNELYLLQDRERSAAILLWVSILKLAAQDNTVYFNNSIDNIAITLFWSMLKDFEKEILSRDRKQVVTSSSTLIYKAKLYIIEHLADALTLKDIANHLHLSDRHVSRLFNQELGQPFTTFLRKQRIRKAGILLSDSTMPIKEIAQQTGFASVHYFTNVFSKEMDMPPGRFREKYHQHHLKTIQRKI